MLGLNSSFLPRTDCLSICLSVSSCVGCGLSLKHGNAFTANNLMRRPGSTFCSARHPYTLHPPPSPFFLIPLLDARMLLPLGQSITLQVGNKVVKTNGLRDKMRLLKLHVCKLTSCVCVCLFICGCFSLFSIANQPASQPE